ncbi:hypothetical protein U1710_02235 [Aeromonas caviae]|uniref:hypothetical protein n=1 Tax=Aeromonas caviae TaxID=648 RepID=UPI0030143337
MFNKNLLFVVAAAMFASTPGIAAQSATLTDSNMVMTDQDPTKARLAECQPLRGDAVEILEQVMNAGGMQGVNVARVKVVTGSCAGTEGWVGLSRLESAK